MKKTQRRAQCPEYRQNHGEPKSGQRQSKALVAEENDQHRVHIHCGNNDFPFLLWLCKQELWDSLVMYKGHTGNRQDTWHTHEIRLPRGGPKEEEAEEATEDGLLL